MHFLVVGHVLHKQIGGKIFAYGPYVREMNLWFQHVDQVTVLAPVTKTAATDPIDLAYEHPNLSLVQVPEFTVLSPGAMMKTASKFPELWSKTWKAMKAADHIHLRCPGNMGLLGAMVQTFFPVKIKSAKYAGNWDRKSTQPSTYRMQQNILSNTNFTKNMQVLVYGDWPNESKNIRPFFTASYSENQIIPIEPLLIGNDQEIRLLFAGGLNSGKQPMVSAQVCAALISRGLDCHLEFYGEGPERKNLEEYIAEQGLQNNIVLHGNVDSVELQQAYQNAHFLIFISQSEGWPKVVAEAMFWACLPITTAVSCVPQMLDFGERGELVQADVSEISDRISSLINDVKLYETKVQKAMNWSRQFTLEKFQEEIKSVIFDRQVSRN
ncbi:glycosyltransferase family 4 protein [Algoriphagus chordae]|uniref:Glycosyltransferase involved in cell wall biosynthesis n=1 Tax=Algoriphagus chordae TaxID=237019 RepID=A0A2W7QK44_9BACT|nr:glycosyltransferase [Algoriphagus chordae]PZX47676.1 glycosyltransferase involved in cell wall biosynthesis [Algoriphagus chordae]